VVANDVKEALAEYPCRCVRHVPLWTVYPEWGWGTDDGARALSLLKDFGSVTVLNGHIHQVVQKVEGNIAFHSAMSTAFPQPKPGTAPSPGPMRFLPTSFGLCSALPASVMFRAGIACRASIRCSRA